MSIGEYIAIAVAFFTLSVSAVLIARKVRVLEVQVKALWPLEKEVADQYETIAAQRKAIEKLQTEAAARNVIIELQGAGIKKLKAEAAVLRDKFDVLIAWVRANVKPGADLNGFLAQLEAGQGG